MTDVLMDIFTPEKPKEKCGDNEREYFIQKLKELQDKLPAYKPAQSEPPFYIPTPIPPYYDPYPKHPSPWWGNLPQT